VDKGHGGGQSCGKYYGIWWMTHRMVGLPDRCGGWAALLCLPEIIARR
jgi:hypothetical protein